LERSQAEVQGMKVSLSRPADPDVQGLRQRCERLDQENEDLKRCLLSVQSQIADAQTRALRAQEGYESTILRLEEQARIHSERLSGLSRDKQFLESQLSRSSDRSHDLEVSLEKARVQNQALEREALETRGRAEELERSLAELRRDHSTQEGSLRELRVQAAAFQERLLHSRATLHEDSERRKEIQDQGEALRRSLSAQEDASRKLGEELRQGMVQGRAESDVRMRETVRFLEEQLHRVEEDASSRYDEFRGLLETLVRVLPQDEEEG
jgi:chromosome segregation ATPase